MPSSTAPTLPLDAGSTPAAASGADLSFKSKLWDAADRMRGHMDPGEYKHIALGLIFLKYISDAFEEHYLALQKEKYADPEDPDEYRGDNIFWVPAEARWSKLQAAAKQPEIGKLIDEAMLAIERENVSLRGVLPKEYARPQLATVRLGELIDLIGSIALGDKTARAQDVLGRVYEYFLLQFAGSEGKRGGEFYTPPSIVRLLVEMIEPYHGRVYDPCCGSSGMFVQSEEFTLAHGGKLNDISICGQESNPTTWRLAKMNLAIRGIEANLGAHAEDTFSHDLHPDLRADYILANPPFNMSYWGGDKLKDDARWQWGVPPVNNANFAWVQHIAHHLSPRGVAGFVLANGSMSSNTGGESAIRRALVEADLVDCMIALPPQLFFGTQIPACLWFLRRDKSGAPNGTDRRGQTLFLDARQTGKLISRTQREFSEEDIAGLVQIYQAWHGQSAGREYSQPYADVPGLCKSAARAEIESHDFILTPGRYVGAEAIESNDEDFATAMSTLTTQWREQQRQAGVLDARIREQLQRIGYGE
jgi:type I restriction enzyme M protein